MKYIGLKLAKHLHEVGFKGENEYFLVDNSEHIKGIGTKKEELLLTKEFFRDITTDFYHTYTYYQIMVDYAKELFGEDEKVVVVEETSFGFHSMDKKYIPGKTAYILDMLQQNKPQEEIDEYIISNLADKWQK
jgi:hypothetical protein